MSSRSSKATLFQISFIFIDSYFEPLKAKNVVTQQHLTLEFQDFLIALGMSYLRWNPHASKQGSNIISSSFSSLRIDAKTALFYAKELLLLFRRNKGSVIIFPSYEGDRLVPMCPKLISIDCKMFKGLYL